ncbi:mechanosensitive channel protein [Pokkaliibacter sp. MBI-7]|uniref:mechanosensitive channel protein n=1 Tax=Pokkaliibacter sp. MBI-7 TaxID=3040600 RepID=UPI002448F0CD|nr:mechanosensitive channel protein [Pokkaliibacter sp. MBI-7]MDH2432034.1 mechanosensitive channel protein [Pokkaliibacter sp. MBI-7]
MLPPRNVARLWLPLMLLFSLTLSALLSSQAHAASGNHQPPADTATYTQLADLLDNPNSREQLISTLRQMAQPAQSTATAAPSDDLSLPRQLAESSKAFMDDIGQQIKESVDAVAELGDLDERQHRIDWQGLTTDAMHLGLTIVSTLLIFLVLRLLTAHLFRKMDHWSLQHEQGQSRHLLRRVLAIGGGGLVDALSVLLTYACSNALTLALIGDAGVMDTQASLFLNGFVLIELFKVLLRLLFSDRYPALRILPMGSDTAQKWYRWLALISSFIGYTLLVAVPLFNFYKQPGLGSALELVVMLIALINAIGMIMRNRKEVTDAIMEHSSSEQMSITRAALQILGRVWHIVAICYFVALFLITQLRPDDALPFMAIATLRTVIYITVGLLLSALLGKLIGTRICISSELRRTLPLLEDRINSYVPAALKVIRLLLLATVIMLVMNAWSLFDTLSWLNSEEGIRLVSTIVHVAVILVISALVWLVAASLIEHRLNPETGSGEPTARAKTLLGLFRNALAIAITAMTVMIVLSEIGIDIGPLIAGAGVLGLAIGFGAQKLVQDIITGVFIQLENAMNTGDVVTVGGVTGTAEKLTIRSVGIRDLNGTYHLIPFSSVDTVSNYMRGFGYHVGEYGVAYRENTDEVLEHLQAAFDELITNPEISRKIVAPLEIHGVTALADSSVNVRVRIKTLPGEQWGIGRQYNRLVKLHLDAAGIEIPFPHMTIYFGEDKQGKAPAANIRMQNTLLTRREKEVSAKADEHTVQEAHPDPVAEINKPKPGQDVAGSDV